MNPDQPSREQIEARITALLLGELPAAEAELLRFTISRDPELQKLHDQLKVTIGFVAEAMKNPTGAPVDRETPLKLAQERRQTLLAHFKTARPQAPQELSWLKRIRIPSRQSLMIAAIIILVICGLAAITLPNFVKARSTSLSNSIINNLRQIDAAKQEWALEQKKSADAVPTPNDLSPYLADQTIRSLGGEKYLLGKVSEPTVAEMNGKQLIASRGTYGSEASSTFEGETATHAMRNGPVVVNEYKPETDQPHVSPNSPGESTITQLPKIALPKTEPPQTESNQSYGEVYSQSVVGYVNLNLSNSQTMVANQFDQAPQTDTDFGAGLRSHDREERLHELSGNAAPPPPSVANASPPPEPPAPEQSQTGQLFVSPSDSGRTYATNFGELGMGNPSAPVVAVGPGGSEPKPEQPKLPPNSVPTFAFAPSQSLAAAPQPEAQAPPPVLMAPPPPVSVGPSAVVAEAPVAESAPHGLVVAPPRDLSKFNSYSALSSRENQNAAAATEPAPSLTLGDVAATAKLENPSADMALVPPRMRQQYGQRNGIVNGPEGQFQPSTTPSQTKEQIQPIPAGGSYFLSGMSPASAQPAPPAAAPESERLSFDGIISGNAASPQVPQQPRVEPNAGLPEPTVNGKNYYAGGGGGVGGFGGFASRSSANNTSSLSGQANTANWYLGNQAVAQSSGRGAAPVFEDSIQNGPLQNRMQTQSYNFPGQLSAGSVTNAIAMNDDQLSSGLNKDSVTREMPNANTAVQSGGGLLYVDNGAVNPATGSRHVHNGAINPVTGLPQVASSGSVVPVVNGVPVTGELFPSSVLRSPAPQRQYAQNEQKLGELQGEYRKEEASEADKKVDQPLARPQATNAAIPQPEVLTSDNAFSTFSMNVSDVSFKLAMASLEKGQMPAPASIRSEEFINAFDYHDPEPLQGEPLAFTSERVSDPFAQERDMLRFSIKAGATGRQDGRALNLVLLLDTSGSMERADRVAIIREALRVLSAQLQPQDIVSVVSFSRTARLWADGIPGNEAGPTLDQVGSITPEGGTNLEEAMRLAYETALRHFIAGGMNRVVLLTDGAANLGNVDPQALTQKVDAERRQGIALDCFGIGWDDYNDDLLEQLSSNGDGRYAFINSPDEAATEFAAKLAGALEVAAEDVKVQVEFNPNRVTAWRQIGYAKHQLTKQQFRDNTVAAGAIASREAGNALYVVETRPDGEGPIATVRVRYRVPGTQDVHEHSWLVDYDGATPELAQSSPAMRLAVTAAEISEWMAESPFAQDVTPDALLNYLSGVPQVYGTDERPKQLETMIREAKSISGR